MSTFDAKQDEFRREVGRALRIGVRQFWPDERHHARGASVRHTLADDGMTTVRAICLSQMVYESLGRPHTSDARFRLASRTIVGDRYPLNWYDPSVNVAGCLVCLNDRRAEDEDYLSFETLRGMVLQAADELDPPRLPAVINTKELVLA